MNIAQILKIADAFEKVVHNNDSKKSSGFTVVGCTRGKIYDYKNAKEIFTEGKDFLYGDELPLQEITLTERPEPKDQGKLYLIKD